MSSEDRWFFLMALGIVIGGPVVIVALVLATAVGAR